MEDKKKSVNIIFIIIATILGVRIFKEFDFEKRQFENPAMAVIYGVVFVFSVYFILKDYKSPTKK